MSTPSVGDTGEFVTLLLPGLQKTLLSYLRYSFAAIRNSFQTQTYLKPEMNYKPHLIPLLGNQYSSAISNVYPIQNYKLSLHVFFQFSVVS